jgi:hypothetical protein
MPSGRGAVFLVCGISTSEVGWEEDNVNGMENGEGRYGGWEERYLGSYAVGLIFGSFAFIRRHFAGRDNLVAGILGLVEEGVVFFDFEARIDEYSAKGEVSQKLEIQRYALVDHFTLFSLLPRLNSGGGVIVLH